MKSIVKGPAVRRSALVLTTLIMLAACAGPAATRAPASVPPGGTPPAATTPTPTTTPTERREPVALNVLPASSSFISSAFIHLPLLLGFYEDEGLDVTVISSFDAGQPDVALVEGQLDMIAGDPETMAKRLIDDPAFPAVCVATTQMWAFRVIVKADSPIQTATDLEGKLIGIPDVSDEGTLKLMLSFTDADPESVETIPTGGRAPMALELMNENIDGAMGSHVDQLAFDTEYGADAFRRIDTMPLGSFNSCMQVRTETLADQPDVVEGLLRAMAKGATVFFEEPELATRLIGQQYPEAYEDLDAALALAAAVVNVHGPAYEARWNFEESEWQELIDKYAEVGFLSEPVDITGVLDFSLLDRVWDFDQQEVLETARDALQQ